jgi:hypothetical protein
MVVEMTDTIMRGATIVEVEVEAGITIMDLKVAQISISTNQS